MVRDRFIGSLILAVSIWVGCQKQHPPNILFITTDYTRAVDLPAMGATFMTLPNLNKLCNEGAVFTHHSCVNPICMPARASWVTGMYPHSHSLWDNADISIKKDDWPFLMRDLQESGYQTIGVGKMHFHPFDADYNFDIRIALEGKDRDYREDDYEKFLNEHDLDRKRIRSTTGKWNLPEGQDVYDWPFAEELHADGFVGEKSIDIIESKRLKKEKPWFMWVSFTGPHNPWNPPARFKERYRTLPDLPTGTFMEGELKNKPIEYTRHRYGYGANLFDIYDALPFEDKVGLRRDLRAAHYGSLSFIDAQIGEILQALQEKNQLTNTIIIFSSDHGSALFDNEMLHKGAHFPTQSLVPFIVWYPGKVKPGKRHDFSSHVDLYPTLLELAKGEIHKKADGHSLVPMFTDQNVGIDSFVVLESTLVTSIMTKQWLAGFHHISQEIDLYNLNEDPMCHKNLAKLPEYGPVINRIRGDLVAWRKRHGPDEIIPSNPLAWDDHLLGDPLEIEKYRKRYIKEYINLTRVNEDRPGVVGNLAKAILKKQNL